MLVSCVYLLVDCKKLSGVNLFSYIRVPVLRYYGTLNTCHHQLVHHSLNLNQDLQEGKLEVFTSIFFPTSSLEEEAILNCHV